MSAHVDETTTGPSAVLGRAKPARGVAARDFARPWRLSPARARALELALKNALPALEKRLAESIGLRVGLALGGVAEIDADQLFAGAVEPLCVLRFRCAKAPAWLVWQPAAAVDAVEALLGTRAGTPAARKLTPTEARLAAQLLVELARGVAAPLGVQASDFALVQVASELGSWRDTGPDAEAHRLVVRLELARGDQTSTVRLYFPGVAAELEQRAPLAGPLPAHLQTVEVELSAQLAGCELYLDQLLALEEGDVLPLDARVGDPTTLSVEGLALAQARLGRHRGRLAVRIERIDVHPEALA